jgi:undecaprenyl-diphosphatase
MTVPTVRWAAAGVVFIALFVALGLLVSRQPLALDVTIADALRGQDLQPAGRVAAVVSDILGPVLPPILGTGLVVGAIVRWRAGDPAFAGVAIRLAVVLLLGRLTSIVFKPVFLRTRPRTYPDLSYPSGHVVSVASTGFVAVLLCVWSAPRLARKVAVVFAVATVLSAASRIVLGVHWLTDTIGSVLGVAGIGLIATVVLRVLPGPRDPVLADTEAA